MPAPVQEYQYDAFLSYVSDDESLAAVLLSQLRESGYRITTQDDFKAGRRAASEAERCVKASRHVLFIVSQRYFESDDVHTKSAREAIQAMHTSIIPIPLLNGAPECLPEWMSQLVPVNFGTGFPFASSYNMLKQGLGPPNVRVSDAHANGRSKTPLKDAFNLRSAPVASVTGTSQAIADEMAQSDSKDRLQATGVVAVKWIGKQFAETLVKLVLGAVLVTIGGILWRGATLRFHPPPALVPYKPPNQVPTGTPTQGQGTAPAPPPPPRHGPTPPDPNPPAPSDDAKKLVEADRNLRAAEAEVNEEQLLYNRLNHVRESQIKHHLRVTPAEVADWNNQVAKLLYRALDHCDRAASLAPRDGHVDDLRHRIFADLGMEGKSEPDVRKKLEQCLSGECR
jgi:hypothetical protein